MCTSNSELLAALAKIAALEVVEFGIDCNRQQREIACAAMLRAEAPSYEERGEKLMGMIDNLREQNAELLAELKIVEPLIYGDAQKRARAAIAKAESHE